MPFVEAKHEQKRHITERDIEGTIETVWERKKTNIEDNVNEHTGAGAPPTYTQSIQKWWAHGQGIQRVWLIVGEKSVFWVFNCNSF